MRKINIAYANQFFTEITPEKTYRWTLASLLGTMIYEAEELFGERDQTYTILGVELISDGPRVVMNWERKHIRIQLGLEATTNMFQACYQLAQETVHLLAPIRREDINVFEEGVSCYFAALFMKEALDTPNWRPNSKKYRDAVEAVAPFLDADRECVRRLRYKQPIFSKMTPKLMKSEIPNITSKQVTCLLSKFYTNNS